ICCRTCCRLLRVLHGKGCPRRGISKQPYRGRNTSDFCRRIFESERGSLSVRREAHRKQRFVTLNARKDVSYRCKILRLYDTSSEKKKINLKPHAKRYRTEYQRTRHCAKYLRCHRYRLGD